MAHAGQEIANPVTGERIRFVQTAAGTGGELLEIEDIWPVGRRPPPHVAWNPGPEEALVTISFRPALRWEEFLERLFALAEEGRTDERGTPEPEALRELMSEFRREIAPARSD